MCQVPSTLLASCEPKVIRCPNKEIEWIENHTMSNSNWSEAHWSWYKAFWSDVFVRKKCHLYGCYGKSQKCRSNRESSIESFFFDLINQMSLVLLNLYPQPLMTEGVSRCNELTLLCVSSNSNIGFMCMRNPIPNKPEPIISKYWLIALLMGFIGWMGMSGIGLGCDVNCTKLALTDSSLPSFSVSVSPWDIERSGVGGGDQFYFSSFFLWDHSVMDVFPSMRFLLWALILIPPPL